MSAGRSFDRAAVVLVAFALVAGGTGCRRLGRSLRGRRHGGVVARTVAPMVRCSDAQTSGPVGSLRFGGAVDGVAIAASGSVAVVAGVVGGQVVGGVPGSHVARIDVPGRGDRASEPVLVARDDGSFGAVFRREREGGSELVARWLARDGSPVGDERVLPLGAPPRPFAAAATHAGMVIAVTRPDSVEVRTLAPSAQSFGDPALLPGSDGAQGVAIACHDERCLGAFTRTEDGHPVVTVATVDPAGGEPHALSAVRPAAMSPGTIALAWSPPHYVVGWIGEATPGTRTVYATAFAADGERLSEPRELGTSSVDAPPSIAAGVDGFGVAWADHDAAGGGFVARWLALDGTAAPRGASRVLAGPRDAADLRPVTTWDGAAFVVARSGARPDALAVHRFGADGCAPATRPR